MWHSKNKFLLAAFCALLSGLYGCSNVEPAAGGGENPAAESQADSVGSIPEDLLANEEKGQQATTAESTEAGNGDPFSDLKAEEKKEDAKSDSNSNELMALTDSSGNDHETAGSGSMETYTVKSGDTLMKIAFSIYGDIDRWKDLQQWNTAKLKKASALRKGMKLTYEAPSSTFEPEQLAHSYLIKKGDTLANIADEVYGKKMKYKKLQGYNPKLIRNPNRIFAGFTIFYDITAKEMAEAEARRTERMAQGGGTTTESSVPSAISPPAESLTPSAPAPVAVAPSVPAPASTGPADMAPPPPPEAVPPPPAN